MSDRQAPAGTQAIGRALSVLRTLAESPAELEAPTIAADLDLSARLRAALASLVDAARAAGG